MAKGNHKVVLNKPSPALSKDEFREELVAHFRSKREELRKLWVERMTEKGLLVGLTKQETEAESAKIYDTVTDCLETGKYEAAEAYATALAERGVLRGMTPEQIIGGMLTLRDVLGRSLAERVVGLIQIEPGMLPESLIEPYQATLKRFEASLDVYEPLANKILSIIALAFIEEREKVVRQQQAAIRELSTPVLQIREKLLILPVIGVLDTQRARQLTEQLLEAIRDRRAKVVVIDITGVPNVDSKVANHLIQTAEAAKILGAQCIYTGVSPEIAQTMVSIGVEVGKIQTVGDLQGGIEQADHVLGIKLIID